jgi:hypothetical protein
MVVDYCLYDSDIVLIFFLQKLVNMFFKCFIHDFTQKRVVRRILIYFQGAPYEKLSLYGIVNLIRQHIRWKPTSPYKIHGRWEA